MASTPRGDEDDCWLWTGSRGAKGHGRYRFRNRGRMFSIYAHRSAYVFTHGTLDP